MLSIAILMLASRIWAQPLGPDETRYKQVRQKASHNSYQRKEDVVEQLARQGVRTVEFDVHIKGKGLAPVGDWLTYHTNADKGANCFYLSDCYQKLVAFHQTMPDHDVITVFFDVNDLKSPGHSKEDFNRLILKNFPQGSVYKPGDLMAACPSAKNLQESVTLSGCAWPRMKDLKGKFIFVVAGGAGYFTRARYDIRNDVPFLATYQDRPELMHEDLDRVFFNMSGPKPGGGEIRKAGFITRAWALNDPASFAQARKVGFNILATDCIDAKEYPWATVGAMDWPFEIIETNLNKFP